MMDLNRKTSKIVIILYIHTSVDSYIMLPENQRPSKNAHA